MARSRLTLVLAASCLLTALAQQPSSDSSTPSNTSSLFCVTFVKPKTEKIILHVNYSDGTDNVTMNLHNNCVRNDTDLLTVRVVEQKTRTFYVSMSYGECAVTCLQMKDGRVQSITTNEEIVCKEDVLQPFKSNENDGFCTNIAMNKSTDQLSTTTVTHDRQTTSSTSDSPHTTTETPLATEESPIPRTPSTPPGPAVALLAVLVVEVVASIILSVVAVMVVREARNPTITPIITITPLSTTPQELHHHPHHRNNTTIHHPSGTPPSPPSSQ
ncbi:uncharacterized protein LOC126995975 isoform X2 [Eriocheir sinensis]|uniref:uncharacterized protein LOC126995975 isoform X2 n=1 Tax=Eriocheir sinensis TaxID=95602 RepID=UPI0021C778F8|nr:uncharacterized protein LOC126995975 isoform X2 [Eriocheir sinensis]